MSPGTAFYRRKAYAFYRGTINGLLMVKSLNHVKTTMSFLVFLTVFRGAPSSWHLLAATELRFLWALLCSSPWSSDHRLAKLWGVTIVMAICQNDKNEQLLKSQEITRNHHPFDKIQVSAFFGPIRTDSAYDYTILYSCKWASKKQPSSLIVRTQFLGLCAHTPYFNPTGGKMVGSSSEHPENYIYI